MLNSLLLKTRNSRAIETICVASFIYPESDAILPTVAQAYFDPSKINGQPVDDFGSWADDGGREPNDPITLFNCDGCGVHFAWTEEHANVARGKIKGGHSLCIACMETPITREVEEVPTGPRIIYASLEKVWEVTLSCKSRKGDDWFNIVYFVRSSLPDLAINVAAKWLPRKWMIDDADGCHAKLRFDLK